MAGINMALNTYVPCDAVANYMYMTEPPKVDNPFVFHDLAWPWYVLPLHAALMLHLIVLNALYRWRFPAGGPSASSVAREDKGADRLPLWQ